MPAGPAQVATREWSIDPDGGTYFTGVWSQARYGKECMKQRKESLAFDGDEPFWTTNAQATWSNGDGVGEVNEEGPYNWPTRGNIIWADRWFPNESSRSDTSKWGYQAYDVQGDASRSCTNGGGDGPGRHRVPSGYCLIVGSYQVRLDSDNTGVTWHSFKFDEIQGSSVMSDAVYGFWHVPNFWAYDPGNGWFYPDFGSANQFDRGDWLSNHDMGYNVCFTDGSVKTYSDAGLSLYKEVLGQQLLRPNRLIPSYDMGMVLNRYFDELYAQD